MMQRIRWFLLLSGIIVLLVVALANQKLAPVKIPFFYEGELNVSTLLLCSSTIGFLCGSLMTAWMLRGHRKKKQAAENASPAPEPAPEPKPDPQPDEPSSPSSPLG